ncbi:MAG TPA: hypothetical protein VLM85_22555 [Polyangiaceae bacterium]|nr:hypothetical protein [Polyangiaceae bacterium]
MALSAVTLAGGGTPPPTTPSTTTTPTPTPTTAGREPSTRQEHICDGFVEAHVITRVDGDALLFDGR